MRLKEFEVPLQGAFYLAVEIESFAGQITRFVVRLMKMAEPDVNLAQGLAGGHGFERGLAICDK
jgi:hypothetical protein